MTIKEVHDFMLMVLRKERSGFVSHEKIDDALDSAQMTVFMRLFGNPKEYQARRPVARYGAMMTQKIVDDLSVFKEVYEFNANNYDVNSNPNGTGPDGALRLPTDYLHLLSLLNVVYDNNIQANRTRPFDTLNEDQLAERIDSQFLAPSALYPCAIVAGRLASDGNRYIQFLPEEGRSGKLWYLRRPAKPNYVYTVSNRVETHNAQASTDLEWADQVVNEIMMLALSLLGVNLGDMGVTQFAESKGNMGV